MLFYPVTRTNTPNMDDTRCIRTKSKAGGARIAGEVGAGNCVCNRWAISICICD